MNEDKHQGHIGEDGGSYVVKKNKKLNILAFILCLLTAFFIWIYVMNTQNSNYTKTFSIPVDVINEDTLLEERGLTVFGVPEITANVTIQGKKADIQKFNEQDFRAYVDVSTIKEAGTASVSVAVETPSAAVSVMEISPKTVNVFVDEMTSITVPIVPFCGGHDDLGLSSDIAYIDIEGPKSYLDDIKEARVEIPYSKDYAEGKTVISSDIKIYDEKQIQLSALHMTFKVDGEVVDSISVEVTSADEK